MKPPTPAPQKRLTFDEMKAVVAEGIARGWISVRTDRAAMPVIDKLRPARPAVKPSAVVIES